MGAKAGAKVCTCKKKKKKPSHALQKVGKEINKSAVALSQQVKLEELFILHPGQEALAFFNVPSGQLPKN